MMKCEVCKKCLHEEPGDLPKPDKRVRKHKFQMAPAPPPEPVLACPPCGHTMHKVCFINQFDRGNHQCPLCKVAYNLRQLRDVKLVEDEVCLNCNQLKATIEAEEKREIQLAKKVNSDLEADKLRLEGIRDHLEKNRSPIRKWLGY